MSNWDETLDAISAVLQGVRITEEDCGSLDGITLPRSPSNPLFCEPYYIRSFSMRSMGRFLIYATDENGNDIPGLNFPTIIGPDEYEIIASVSSIEKLAVSSPITCRAREGVCARCYGADPESLRVRRIGEEVGQEAVAALRNPAKGPLFDTPSYEPGCIPEVVPAAASGIVRFGPLYKGMSLRERRDYYTDLLYPVLYLRDEQESGRSFTIAIEGSEEVHELTNGMELLVIDGEKVSPGDPLYRITRPDVQQYVAPPYDMDFPRRLLELQTRQPAAIYTPISGDVSLVKEAGATITVQYPAGSSWTLKVDPPDLDRICVLNGDYIEAGEEVIDGFQDYRQKFKILSERAIAEEFLYLLQRYFERRRTYIEDRHLELIIAWMLKWCEVTDPGDTGLATGDVLLRDDSYDLNVLTIERGRKVGIALPCILGISQVRDLVQNKGKK